MKRICQNGIGGLSDVYCRQSMAHHHAVVAYDVCGPCCTLGASWTLVHRMKEEDKAEACAWGACIVIGLMVLALIVAYQ